MISGRYVYDTLYGPITFPEYVWDAALCPEFQRLREIRMCNINSLCLTGGSNISRYEHCLGVAHLALECLASWPLRPSVEETKLIVLAALLHDVGSSAFGHSVQYVISSQGFEHESFYDIVTGQAKAGEFAYRRALADPIYFGSPRRLHRLHKESALRSISDMVEGRGEFGPLISGTIDLDNIDNVFRLAYHVGLTRDGTAALRLARSLSINNGVLVVAAGAEDALREWYDVRRRLYDFLLLNPDEFSAKCMLEEALEFTAANDPECFRWNDVDFELLEKLSKSSDETRQIISRLAVGDLYGCAGIYSSPDLELYDRLQDPAYRQQIESALAVAIRETAPGPFRKAIPALHVIKDVNKTQRTITIPCADGTQISVGVPLRRILVGVFFKNVRLSMAKLTLDQITGPPLASSIKATLATAMAQPDLISLPLYGEVGD